MRGIGLAAFVVVPLFTTIARADAPKCPVAAARVVAHGVWLGVTGGARCFVPNKDGKVDEAVLGPGLAAISAARDASCDHAIEIAGDNAVAYQDIITTMDLAVKAGLTDVGLTDPPGLTVKLDDSAALESKARRCAAAPASSSVTMTTTDRAVVADAPIVVVTGTDVSLDGTSVGDAKTLAKGKGAIPALAKALKGHKGGDKHTAILEADKSSSVAVINRVVATSKQAGFDNLLFAVKNK
jgi:biopolymer transport protein ExbD